MTEGILIYALNNSAINYLELAMYAAQRAKYYLEKPVALITDSAEWFIENYPNYESLIDVLISVVYEDKGEFENQVVFHPISQNRIYFDGTLTTKVLSFKNDIRIKSYEITPFDKTLVMDADYIIGNNNLKQAWLQKKDMLIYKKSMDLSGFRFDPRTVTISDKTIDFYWATIFYFEKNNKSKIFFDLLEHIFENWNYYSLLYQLENRMYRNDYAFSMAIHVLNGFQNNEIVGEFPGKLYYTLDKDILVDINENKFKFLVEKQDYHGEYTLLKVEGLDVHVMNKFSLERFIKGFK